MAIVMTKRANYEGIANALRSLHNGEETYTPAEMAEYLATQGTELKPENIAKGVTIFGVVGTLEFAPSPDWPGNLPVDEEDADNAVDDLLPEGETVNNKADKFVLADDKGNVTIAYMMGENFAFTSYDSDTTDFKAIGWIRLSYHTTGENAGKFTLRDFRTEESGGWNYLKNIRYCSRDALYYNGEQIWPNAYFLYNWDDFSSTSTKFGDYALGQLPLTFTANYTAGGNYVGFPDYIHLFPEGKALNISKGDKIDITVYTPEMTYVFYGSAMLEEIDFSLIFAEKNYSSSSNNGMSYFRHRITENRFEVINGGTSTLSPVFEPESLVYEVFYDGDKVIGFHAQGIASVDIDYLSIGATTTADRYTTGYSMRWQFTNSNPLRLTITKE